MPMSNRSALFKAIETTSLDAIVTIDEHGHILSFNPTAQKLFGYSEAEVLGWNVSRLMPRHFREHHDDYIRSYLQTGDRKIIGIGRVVAGERRDGTTFPLELAVGEAMVEDHRVFVGFLRDLTATERDNRRLQELQSELFHVSRLSEMGQIASGLAHEVNQPLGAIMNYAEVGRTLSEQPSVPPAMGSLLGKIDEQARRAAEIIRRLRAFIEKREIEKHSEPLNALIEESLGLALIGPAAARVRISVDLQRRAPNVCVDKVQIQQVLVNLLRNAVDAMDAQEDAQLRVSARRAAPGKVEILVSDNGPGIEPEVADKLFSAFVTTKAHGMGVGLSISSTIIEAHGGRLWYTQNADRGTTFHFTLPVSAQDGMRDG